MFSVYLPSSQQINKVKKNADRQTEVTTEHKSPHGLSNQHDGSHHHEWDLLWRGTVLTTGKLQQYFSLL